MQVESRKEFQEMLELKDQLSKEIYDVVNRWMARPECEKEPDIALGMFLGAIAEASGNYTALYRFMNHLSDEWSKTCINANAQVFANSHHAHLQDLAKSATDDGMPPIVN